MSRTPTPLNITEIPGVGMAYVVKTIANGKLVRAATTCQRDIDRKDSKVKVLRQLSGEHPFFTAKIGSLKTGTTVLKFLCGKADGKKCRDEDGKYEWIELSLSDAKKKNMQFEQPNYVGAAPVAVEEKKQPVKKVATKKSTKKVQKATKKKVVDVVITKKKAQKAPVEAEPVMEMVPQPKLLPVQEVDFPAPVEKKAEQTDEEFEAEITADFETELNKAIARAEKQ